MTGNGSFLKNPIRPKTSTIPNPSSNLGTGAQKPTYKKLVKTMTDTVDIENSDIEQPLETEDFTAAIDLDPGQETPDEDECDEDCEEDEDCCCSDDEDED